MTRRRCLRIVEPIVNAPIARDLPRLNAVVGALYAVLRGEGLIPELGDLLSRRLDRAQFVGAAGSELALFSVPSPRQGKPNVCHSMCRRPQLGVFPALAAVGGYFHPLNSAATGPSQSTDLVISRAAGQFLSRGREGDDRFRSDLFGQRD